jgi:hypothetical protein
MCVFAVNCNVISEIQERWGKGILSRPAPQKVLTESQWKYCMDKSLKGITQYYLIGTTFPVEASAYDMTI